MIPQLSAAGEVFLATWRLCETFFWRWRKSAGIGLRAVLAYELESRGLRVVRQQAVPIVYHGTRIEMGFRADLIVEDLAIMEIKSVEAVASVRKKQLLTHLRLADKRLGPLINFSVALLKTASRELPTACRIDLTHRRKDASLSTGCQYSSSV